MKSFLQTDIFLFSFKEFSSKTKESYLESVYKKGLRAKQMGAQRLLLRFSGSSFSSRGKKR